MVTTWRVHCDCVLEVTQLGGALTHADASWREFEPTDSGVRTGRKLLANDRCQFNRVRRVARGTFVDSHTRTREGDNDMTQRNPAHLAKSLCF